MYFVNMISKNIGTILVFVIEPCLFIDKCVTFTEKQHKIAYQSFKNDVSEVINFSSDEEICALYNEYQNRIGIHLRFQNTANYSTQP